MNRNEALEVLGFKPGSSPLEKEIKKAFKRKAAKAHPDVNKSENADVEFKKINDAKDTLLNPKNEGIPSVNVGNPHVWDDILHNFGFNFHNRSSHKRRRRHVHIAHNIQTQIKITFKESILGCDKDININRVKLCSECGGNGDFETHDNCHDCGGAGFSSNQQGHIHINVSCSTCQGSGRKYEKCDDCAGKGALPVSTQISVSIPGGVHKGQEITVRQAGNELPGGMRGNVIIVVDVEPEENMVLRGGDVISNIDISLLEALKGTTKKVHTVKGEAALIIGARSKNKNEAKLIGYGVNNKNYMGDHIFILNVKYPDDLSDLINVLEKKE